MRLLIADDNEGVLEQLQSYLKPRVTELFVVRDGLEALELFESHEIDGVISAYTMPQMGGIGLLQELKKREKGIPFVIMSRHGNAKNILQCLNQGACDFLTKPLQEHDIEQSLNKIRSLGEDSRFSLYCLEHSTLESRTLEITNDFEYINRIVVFISRNLPTFGILSEDDLFTMQIILGEALENAIFHGNLEVSSKLKKQRFELFQEEGSKRRTISPYKDRKVYISYEISRREVKYVMRDEGNGFDRSQLPDPTDPENLFKVSGRGILLIMNFMDHVSWNEKGNEITMIRYKQESS